MSDITEDFSDGSRASGRKSKGRLIDVNTGALRRDHVLVQRTPGVELFIGFGRGAGQALDFAFEGKINGDPFFANCEAADKALTSGDLAKARQLGASDELANISDPHLRRLALVETMIGKASPDDPKHPGWPGGAPDSQGGEFRPKDEATAQSDVPKQVASDKMKTDEVGNIVFNETRSLSGKGIGDARIAIAHAIRNGEEKHGEKRPKTAPPNVGNIPSAEAGAYRDSQNAANRADSERAHGTDPTHGATHFNITFGRSTKRFEGHKHIRSYGPFKNSYTGGDVPRKKNVYVNLYE